MKIRCGGWLEPPNHFPIDRTTPHLHPGVMRTKDVNITELLHDGRHFAERKGDLIHIIDSLTGRSVVIYSDPGHGLPPITYQEVLAADGTVTYHQAGLPAVIPRHREIVFNPVTIDLICQAISNGKGLTEVCTMPGMPTYPTLNRWRRQHSWINEALELARRDRAEWHRDQALSEAADATSRDPVAASSLRVDTHKWAASTDHERYNPKTKVEATINTPTQIVIHTGIDRTPKDVTPTLPGVVKDE